MRLRRPISPSYATPQEAIAYIASVCDGAVKRDGHGFATSHVDRGHKLARARWWGPLARRRAHRLVRVYQSQLVRAGYDVRGLLNGARPARISRRAAQQVPAAWSRDPTGVRRFRYWNGMRWTPLCADDLTPSPLWGGPVRAPDLAKQAQTQPNQERTYLNSRDPGQPAYTC